MSPSTSPTAEVEPEARGGTPPSAETVSTDADTGPATAADGEAHSASEAGSAAPKAGGPENDARSVEIDEEWGEVGSEGTEPPSAEGPAAEAPTSESPVEEVGSSRRAAPEPREEASTGRTSVPVLEHSVELTMANAAYRAQAKSDSATEEREPEGSATATAVEGDPASSGESSEGEGGGVRVAMEQRGDGGNFSAGRDFHQHNEFLAESETPTFERHEVLGRTRQVFIPPPEFEEAVEDVQRAKSHIVLVHGEKDMGKWTCAQNVAHRLAAIDAVGDNEAGRERRQVWVCRVRDLQFDRIVRDEGLPAHAVLLLTDCPSSAADWSDLEASGPDWLTAPLRDKDCFLVLTATLPPELRPEALELVRVEARYPHLDQVLERHLESLVDREELSLRESAAEFVAAYWSDLARELDRPRQIQRFCDLLARDPQVARGDGDDRGRMLVALAREAVEDQTLADPGWFGRLEPSERLLGLLAHLFGEVDASWLETIYNQQVHRLREAGVAGFADSRDLDLATIRDRLHLVEKRNSLAFEKPSHERQVRRELEGRQELLWDVLAELESLEPQEEWRRSTRLSAYGTALARLGKSEMVRTRAIRRRAVRFRVVLERFGASEEALRAVLPIYAFKELLQDDDADFDWVEDVLSEWAHSPNLRLQRSAALAIPAVYQRLHAGGQADLAAEQKDAVMRLLGELISRLNKLPLLTKGDDEQDPAARQRHRQEVFVSTYLGLASALSKILWRDPQFVAPEMARWLAETRGSSRSVVRLAIRSVFAKHAKRFGPSPRAEIDALLTLVAPLLECASDESQDVRTVFLALRAWLREAAAARRVFRRLLRVATHGSVKARRRLCRALARLWLDPEPEEMVTLAVQPMSRVRIGDEDETAAKAAFLAHAIFTRCRAVDGTLPIHPAKAPAVAVVDPRLVSMPEEDGSSRSAVLLLLGILRCRFDVRLHWLGDRRAIPLQADGRSAWTLRPRVSSPRLLMPALPRDAADLYLLSSEPPADLPDVEAFGGVRAIYHLGGGSERDSGAETFADGHGAATSGRLRTVVLSWPPQEVDLAAAEDMLEEAWAARLVNAVDDAAEGAGVHLPARLRLAGKPTVDRVWAALEEAVENLASEATVFPARPFCRPSQPGLEISVADQDPVSRAIGLILWLAAADLDRCLRRLAAWLQGGVGAPESPVDWVDAETDTVPSVASPRAIIATAGAFALLRFHTAATSRWGETGVRAQLFDHLAHPLALQGTDATDAVIRFILHRATDSAWAAHLAGGRGRDGRSRLERWAAAHLADREESVATLTRGLEAAWPRQNPSINGAALRVLGPRLQACRAFGAPADLPPLAAGGRYLWLVADTGHPDESRRRTLASLLLEFYARLAKQPGIAPVIQRLGQARPFWTDRDERPSRARLLAEPHRPSPLLGPHLAHWRHHLGRVAAVVLISDRTPMDLLDWQDSPWWPKILLHAGDGRSPTTRVAAQPRPLAEPWSHHLEGRPAGTGLGFEARRLAEALLPPFVPHTHLPSSMADGG